MNNTELNARLTHFRKNKMIHEVSTYRQIKAEVETVIKSGSADTEVTEGMIDQAVRKLIKQHLESIDAFDKANYTKQAQKERDELEVLNSLVPKPVIGEELKQIVSEIIKSVGVTSMRDMGKVMAQLKVDNIECSGRDVSSAIKELLK